jgi:hypothetical protein
MAGLVWFQRAAIPERIVEKSDPEKLRCAITSGNR